MQNDFSNITNLIYENWQASTNNQPIFSDSNAQDLSRNDFLLAVSFRKNMLKNSLSPGDNIMISSGRGIDFFIDLLAVWSLGGIAIPYPNTSSKEAIEKIKNISSATLLLNEKLQPLSSQELSSTALCSHTFKTININNQNLCAILFTSGSTGEPKGVMLSSYNLVHNSLNTLKVLKIEKERLFVNVPFHFTSAICHFLACCFSNSTFIGVEDKLMLGAFAESIISSNASGVGGAPVQLRWLNDYTQATKSLSNLRFFISSGDYLAFDVIEESSVCLPNLNIFVIYGLTELGGRFCILNTGLTKHNGSVGKPIEGLRIKVFDEDKNIEVPANTEGELVASGSLISKGYYKNTKATEASFHEYGFRTGDLGYIDKLGFVHIKGRADDVFKVNGQKVSSIQIINALLKLSIFSDMAVIPINIDLFGTVPFAFYTLKDGCEFNKGSILKRLRKSLPSNHMPHEFICLKSIPRTGSGKIKRTELVSIITQAN